MDAPPRDARPGILIAHEMPDHPKVAPLSDAAFRLLIRAWAYCSRLETDGRIPATVWTQMGPAKARAELLRPPVMAPDASPLVIAHDGYVECHDYLAHQRSSDEIAVMRDKKEWAGKKGAHTRWHVLTRTPDPSCEFCRGGEPDARTA